MADWLIVKWNRQKPPFFVGFMGQSVRAVADDRLNVEILLRSACRFVRIAVRSQDYPDVACVGVIEPFFQRIF